MSYSIPATIYSLFQKNICLLIYNIIFDPKDWGGYEIETIGL